MTRGNLVLTAIVAAELFAAGSAVAWKSNQPAPPAPGLKRLDPMTAADLGRLRDAARDGSPDRWRALGEAWLAHGFLAEADVAYRRAAELRPDSFQILYGLAFSLERLGQTGEAVEHFQRAVVLAPPEMVPTCWYHIGRCFLRDENASQAEAAFHRAAEFPPVAYQRAKLAIRSGRIDEGLLILDRFPEPYGNMRQPLQLRMSAERDLGRAESAAQIRDLAERTDATLPLNDVSDYLTPIRQRFGPNRRIAECSASRKESGRSAIAGCLDALIDEMEFWDARYLIPEVVELHLELGEADVALRLIDQYLERSNVTPQILQLRGDALSTLGMHEESRAVWQRAAALCDTPSIHSRLADDARRRGDEEALRRHQAMALHAAGVEAFRAGQLPTAIPPLEQALTLDSGRAATWFYLGECRQVTDDLAGATQAYENCLEFSPAHGRAAERLDRLRSPAEAAARRADQPRSITRMQPTAGVESSHGR